MIDWLTFVAPLDHLSGQGGPFWNGEVMSTMPDPELGETIEWAKLKRMPLVGSYSQQVFISSTTDSEGLPAILVSGNPAKWFQGHNVFGSDDLPGLVLEMLLRICATAGVTPSAENLRCWYAGRIELLRVDVTNSWDLLNRARVRAALKALDATAHLRHRGRGQFYGDALTFGGGGKNKPGSRRWSLTLYAKGPELEVHPLPVDLADSSLPAFADGLLRAEVRMLAMELKREELHRVSAWGDNTAQELHARKFSGLQVSDATMLQAQVLEGLPGRLQGAYQLWRDGHDLRGIFSRATFYRYRTELLKHGIDIAVSQSKPADQSNVVPLRVVLNAHPVGVPSWATGTPLYFEPRAKFG
jgi:II/X family phage/plasmid replication protein